jgi:hypothetical protein
MEYPRYLDCQRDTCVGLRRDPPPGYLQLGIRKRWDPSRGYEVTETAPRYSPRLGDVITTAWRGPWYKIMGSIPSARIRHHQKSLGFSDYGDTHVVLYLGEIPESDRSVATAKGMPYYEFRELVPHKDWCLSVTFPRTKFVRLSEIWDTDSSWRAWRSVHYAFRDPVDAEILRPYAWELWNTRYDELQLLGIRSNALRHVPQGQWRSVLEWGDKRRVCSTGTAHCLTEFRAERRRRTKLTAQDLMDIALGRSPDPRKLEYPFPPLFSRRVHVPPPNKGSFLQLVHRKVVTPAHFSNYPDHFYRAG